MPARNFADNKMENELREKEVRWRAGLWQADVGLFVWSICCGGSFLYRLKHMPVESIWIGDGLIPRQHIEQLRKEIVVIALVWMVFLLVAILRKTRLLPIPISTIRLIYTCLMAIAGIALTQLDNWCEQHRYSDVITLEMMLFCTMWLMTIHMYAVLVMLIIELFATNKIPMRVPFDPRSGIYPEASGALAPHPGQR